MSCVSLLSPLALLPPNTNTKPEESNCAYYSRADPVAHAGARTQSSPTEFGACYQKLASFFAGEASHILQNSACLRADLSSSMCLPLSLPHSSFSNSSVPCVCLALLSPLLTRLHPPSPHPFALFPLLTPFHTLLWCAGKRAQQDAVEAERRRQGQTAKASAHKISPNKG